MLILAEANTLKPTSFAGSRRLKDVTSVWKGKTAADSQWDQHVSRTFSTLENCRIWVYKLNCVGHRRFLFSPRQAETSFHKQAFDRRRLLMSRATTFMFILNWRPACTPSGASCQNNALMDRWLGSCSLMTMNISDTACDICLLMPHYVAGKYPKYLAWHPTRLPLEKLTS